MERYFIIHLGACDIDNWARRSYYNLLFPKIRFESVILGARMIVLSIESFIFTEIAREIQIQFVRLYLWSRGKMVIRLKFKTIIICKSFFGRGTQFKKKKGIVWQLQQFRNNLINSDEYKKIIYIIRGNSIVQEDKEKFAES